MPLRSSVVDAVGQTPLIKLRRASEETGCTILGKAEFMNPGQSVKDRAAFGIITDAVQQGRLKPGGTIVEGTAGNTGIGLTVLGNAQGFRTVIVIPDTQAQEKKDTLRLLGAEVVEVPAVPYRNPNNYVKYSARLADLLDKSETAGAIWANQFDNTANRDIHMTTTAEEIWADTNGKVDGFVAAVGSGGTLGGVSRGLKAKRSDIRIALADPPGSALYAYYTHRRAQGRRVVDHRGHRPGPHHRQPRRRADRYAPIRSPTRRACASSSISSPRKVSASAPRAASTSPAPSASPRSSAPVIRS